jgi:hypothetical protein
MEEKGEKGDLLIYFISGFIFISAFLFYIGIVISKNISHPVTYGLFWFIYIITLITFGNSLFNYYTLVTLNKKEAVIGSQGEKGQPGDVGEDGECERDCKLKVYSNVVLAKLDTAYNKILEKTRNTTINPPRKINNQYIKNLVIRICDSQQFKDVSQLKHPSNLVDYITEIFIKWIDIIANADNSEGKKHFQDYMEIYGEQIEWESIIEPKNNPFHEIEKYDIFYWGLDKEFHPIKIQNCLPQEKVTKQKPPIKLIKTNIYKKITDDEKMGSRKSMSLWMTEPMKFQGDTYYPLGTVAIPNFKPNIGGGRFIETIFGDNPVRYDLEGSKFTGPTKTNVMISADSKWIKFPNPNKWSWRWSAQKRTDWRAKIRMAFRKIGGKEMTFYNAEDFYEDGELYRCFGSAIIPRNIEPNISWFNPSRFFGRDKVQMVCVNDKALERVPHAHRKLWDEARAERRRTGAIYSNEDGLYNLAYFHNSNNPDYNRKTYRIKKEFIDETKLNEPPFTSEEEKETGFAIGFQDVNYEVNRKGSLFDLLDLVIKSPLQSIYTSQMLFIEHTGLNNPNSYFIKTSKGKCIKVASNNEKIELKDCNVSQDSQVWEVEYLGQSKEICLLKSVNTGKYLYSTKSNVFFITGDLQSRNINDRLLKPFQWRITKTKSK